MKLIAVILSLYFLALSTVPKCITVCEDEACCFDENSGVNRDEHEEEHHHHEDICNPQCICHCCRSMDTFRVQIVLFTKHTYTRYKDYKPITSESFFVSSYLNAIWRPPKTII